MTTLFALAMTTLAGAQTCEPLRIDPDYEAYLVALEQLGSSPTYAPPAGPQLLDGMVSLVGEGGLDVGTVFVDGAMPQYTEHFFLPQKLIPGADFGFRHDGDYEFGTEGAELDNGMDPNWEQHPCYELNVLYVEKPNKALTAKLDYTNGIDRYHFKLWQGGQVVGRMLREHHHVNYMPEKFVEHWAFQNDYTFPEDEESPMLFVIKPATQYATTTAFFDSLNQNPAAWLSYAQVTYSATTIGADCLP